jgi:citrate lyase subunit beta / citryl-CoA lyase
MRSKLFVPGSRTELFAKALAGEADAISFDVEDSVPEGVKARARQDVADFLRARATRESSKLIIVRINAWGSPHFDADLAAFACAGVTLLNLPKVLSGSEVQSAAGLLAEAERRNGIREPIRLLVNIESARAMRLAAEIAGAHPRVAGLQLGLADMFESLHIDRRDTRNAHAAMFAVRLAAGEHGRFAYDSAFPDIQDEEGFRREAEQAKQLGYLGKSCVHPKQVALANEIFSNDALSLATARRIVAAAELAEKQGRGAFLLDGRMIDLPIIRRAQAMLAEANDGSGS